MVKCDDTDFASKKCKKTQVWWEKPSQSQSYICHAVVDEGF